MPDLISESLESRGSRATSASARASVGGSGSSHSGGGVDDGGEGGDVVVVVGGGGGGAGGGKAVSAAATVAAGWRQPALQLLRGDDHTTAGIRAPFQGLQGALASQLRSGITHELSCTPGMQ